jgi:hypothetical protein
MTVSAADLAALGVSLADVAARLEQAGDGGRDSPAFGPGEAARAFEHLIEGWRRQRLALVEQLESLSEKAFTAGGAYVETEASVGRSLAGGRQ